jgi:hypothetical protein
MNRFFSRVFVTLSCAISLGGSLVLPLAASAQGQPSGTTDVAGLNQVAAVTKLSAEDPRVIAVRVINVALGLIGIIMVCLMVYAGFLWMTAGGDQEQVERAKKVIRNAIIGLIIILSSWGITKYVLSALTDATGIGGSSSSGQNGSAFGGGLGSSGGSFSSFHLQAINPEGDVPLRNVQVRFLFSQDVDATQVPANLKVAKADGTVIDGRWEIEGTLVTFTPRANCPAPASDRFCFDANTSFVATVGSAFKSASGQRIGCGGLAPVCEGHFHTGTIVDVTGPSTYLMNPFDGQSVPVDGLVAIETHAEDPSGISQIQSSVDGHLLGRTAPDASSTPVTFDGRLFWDTHGVATGTHRIESTAFDTDSNQSAAAPVTVVVREASYFDGVRDGTETGVDCGGTGGGICSGGACTVSSACASGVCSAGRCVERPIITRITPNDGRAGTIVTIEGVNFGNTPGTVMFPGGHEAHFPAQCTASGVGGWTENQVVVEVPAGATSGPVTLTNHISGLADSTSDETGPRLSDFTVNTVLHPGLCAVDPGHGDIGQAIRVSGAGLGSSPDRVLFNDSAVTTFREWSDTGIGLNVPVQTPGQATIQAQIAGDVSNPVGFSIDERTTAQAPVIQSLSPAHGPIGEYITIHGQHFGDRAGLVRFRSAAGREGNADTDFPDACDAGTRYWSDTAVVFKVPASLAGGGLLAEAVAPGAFEVFVQTQEGGASNHQAFTVEAGEPDPGICALQPDTGPAGTEVNIIGERLGATAGTIRFQGASPTSHVLASDVVSWSSQSIRVRVPSGAKTGMASVAVGEKTSNELPFTVRNCNESADICSSSERCCTGSGVCVPVSGGVCPATALDAHYAWRLSTGELALSPEVVEECNPTSHLVSSPSPWDGRAGGGQACVNADGIIRFTTQLSPASVNGTNVFVRTCPAADGDCSTGTLVPLATGFPRLEAASTDADLIRFRPASTDGRWTPNTHYEVVLRTGISSLRGIPMTENAAKCGTGNAYCFRFSTRTSADPCRVGSVLVNPGTYSFADIDETTDYHADPLAQDDVCLQLNPDGLPWRWAVTNRDGGADGRVLITHLAAPAGELPDQTGTARTETTESDPALVQATVREGTASIVGTGEAFVSLLRPRIEAYGPNCDQACVNAGIWARFNVGMLPASITPENVVLRRCTDAACTSFDTAFTLTSDRLSLSAAPGSTVAAGASPILNYLQIDPTHGSGTARTSYLRAGQYYQVILRTTGASGIRSRYNQPLTELNNPDGFAWTFHTREDGDGRCAVDHVTLAPAERIESEIGARQRFKAVPYSPPDTCSATGEALVSDRPYAWSSVHDDGSPDTTVARLVERTTADGTISDADATVRAGTSTSDEQLAEIIASRDPATGETISQTNIQATYEGRDGRAIYGLQCGLTAEASCRAGYGLTIGGCCSLRPAVETRYPTIGSTGICRNVEISADFNMALNPGSVSQNVLLAEHVVGGTTCAEGTTVLAANGVAPAVSWFGRAWQRVVAFFHPSSAIADAWCVGAVPAQAETVELTHGSRVVLRIQAALRANTEYRVFLRGEDDLTTTTRRGIVTDRGVKFLNETTPWTFRTGSAVCAANHVSMEDTNSDSPYLFTKHPESHGFRATVESLTSGSPTPAPITPVREYDWRWGAWLSSDDHVLTATVDPSARAGDAATIATQNKNGSAFISARIRITRDDVNTPTTSGTVIETARNASVMLCERPWQSLALAPFADAAGSRSLPSLFAAGPFYNFSTMYCMDAGAPGEEGDLPALQLSPVPLTALDRSSGILRQYLFTFSDPAFKGDGIGIRIAENPFHLSASQWYAARGFSGSPQELTIDGYEAVRDGATLYVAATNVDGSGSGNVYSNIYVLSYNPNAKPETLEIAKQMEANLLFNVNLEQETHNHCVEPTAGGASPIFLNNGAAVSCTADWECAAYREDLHCASTKAKLQRDRVRLGDMQAMTRQLEQQKARQRSYPAANSGTFIAGLASSRWPSWGQSFGQEVGGSLPQDPVNRYMACGRCKSGTTLGKVCSETSECAPSETCVSEMGTDASRNGFEPATCWNPATQHYFCPALIGSNGSVVQDSHVYQYRALDNGARYELSLNFEGPAANRYRPALLQEVRRCSNKDQMCGTDADCRIFNIDGSVRSTGTCAATGGSWVYGGACRNVDYARSSSCGSSVLASDQVCRSGDTRTVSCTAAGGVAGTKVQVCSDCRAFVDGPATTCVPAVQCGNGRVDAGEACDDGSNNGRYGYCARNCQALTGFCGDGVIAAGEACDNGSTPSSRVSTAPGINGQYCGADCTLANSCSIDCRAQAPHCGDGHVDPEEQCDGNVERTADAIGRIGEVGYLRACNTVTAQRCAGGARSGEVCTSDAECGTGGRCVSYPTQHVRTCLPPGDPRQCLFSGWSACQPVGVCGDGIVDRGSGEECDDGAAGNSGRGRCTPQCKLNVCGDAYMQDGVEECDNGARNGRPPAELTYGTPTPMCTTQCRVVSVSGGYCGNGVREEGEVCDGTQFPRDASCRTLGFDYADRVDGGGRDVMTCSPTCQPLGCHVCTERLAPSPDNSITGHVLDAVVQNIRLPNATVNLRFNGVDIAQTHTDAEGTFTFSGLHTNAACGNYTLVIALQGVRLNRTATPPVLERTSDPDQGYLTYTSQPFSRSTFLDVVGNDSGDIYLMPHVGDGETLVVRQWNNGGSTHNYLWNQQIDVQLLLPQGMGYTPMPDGAVSTHAVDRCTWGGSVGRSGCQRTINYSQYVGAERYGQTNLELNPHARLYCYEEGGGNTCSTMASRIESVFYKRYEPVSGKYRYFLVNFHPEDPTLPSEQTIRSPEAKNRIRVVWRDQDGREQYTEFVPPTTVPTLTMPGGGGSYTAYYKYWFVFEQDAITGQLTPINRLLGQDHLEAQPTIPRCDPGSLAAGSSDFTFVDDNGTRTCPMNALTEVY